jgi:leucyl-tRNA---protein transferase
MRPLNRRVIRPGAEARLIVVHDQPQECPYLQGITARMPLRLPIGRLDPPAMDALFALGYRRTGDFLYRTECAPCHACEPTRVIVDRFQWTRSLTRVLRRGDALLTMSVGPPQCDSQRIDLFNRHRQERGLARDEEQVDEAGYRAFLVESCCDSLEMAFWLDGQLAAVAIVDAGQDSLSAVYTHFDPELPRLSLGTYAVLKQIQYAAETGRSYVYLGMYVAANRHLNYKARYRPQQRYTEGSWKNGER